MKPAPSPPSHLPLGLVTRLAAHWQANPPQGHDRGLLARLYRSHGQKIKAAAAMIATGPLSQATYARIAADLHSKAPSATVAAPKPAQTVNAPAARPTPQATASKATTPAAAPPPDPRLNRKAFDEMKPAERMAYVKTGGKIHD